MGQPVSIAHLPSTVAGQNMNDANGCDCCAPVIPHCYAVWQTTLHCVDDEISAPYYDGPTFVGLDCYGHNAYPAWTNTDTQNPTYRCALTMWVATDEACHAIRRLDGGYDYYNTCTHSTTPPALPTDAVAQGQKTDCCSCQCLRGAMPTTCAVNFDIDVYPPSSPYGTLGSASGVATRVADCPYPKYTFSIPGITATLNGSSYTSPDVTGSFYLVYGYVCGWVMHIDQVSDPAHDTSLTVKNGFGHPVGPHGDYGSTGNSLTDGTNGYEIHNIVVS